MRIIRGKYKGKHITAPKSFDARPTTDFAKEGLFNLIEYEIDYENLSALDLFSGTGNISFELLSRGAVNVTVVEISKRYADYIERTGEQLFPGQMRVITGDAFKFLGRSPLNYDFIFADPPYELDGIADIPNLVFASKSLKSDALFILEHSIAHSFAEHPNFVKEKKYGKVHFSFFKNKPTE